MKPLYELTGQLLALQDLEDVPEEALKDTLEALEGEFNEKAVRICHVLANADGSVEAIDNEIKRLQAKKKSIVSNKERLKDYLRENMERCEITKISSDLFNVTLMKPREAVVIDSEDRLDIDYMRVTYAPDKKKIMDALKNGQDVPGAHLGLGKSGVRIS